MIRSASKTRSLWRQIEENMKKSGLEDAAISGEATVGGHPVIVVIMDFSFMGGSNGLGCRREGGACGETALEKKIRS